MEEQIVYFESPGAEHTAEVLDIVAAALARTGITTVVVASTSGDTARMAMERLKGRGIRLVIVPHQYGLRKEREFSVEVERRAREEGHIVYWGTMLFHTEKLYGFETPRVIADFLRVFCEGMKVCVEILLMAGNAGLVGAGEQVIVIAGTGRGADTAVIATRATTMDVKRMRISRILCKPL